MTRTVEADYLVVGTGAVGMAFTDALIAASDARVAMVDRRHAPGGHWHDAYPFVRLHQPSAFYGVNSLPLGEGRIDANGANAGLSERATGAEICGYYARVMDHVLLASGRVEHFPQCEYLGGRRFSSRLSGVEYEVSSGAKVVDARYLEPAVPRTTAPPFDLEDGVRCVPVHGLAEVEDPPSDYVVVGAGKTAMDACLWLLQGGVPPERIRWVKPRESWLVNREFVQPGERVGSIVEGLSLQMRAAAEASSLEDLFGRLEDARQLLRVDSSVEPTMYKLATVSEAELEELRRITGVVRRGRVRRISRDHIELDGGKVPTSATTLHVHCAASALSRAPSVPIFAEDRIVPQPVRSGLPPFNASLIAFVEATRDDVDEKNRLCPPNPLPDAPIDWLRGRLVQARADHAWSNDPEISEWLGRSRLNPSFGLSALADDPAVREATERYRKYVGPGLERLASLVQGA